MLKKHSKAKKLLTLFIALTFLMSMVGSAFAATVHVGTVGFDTDKLDNNAAYLGAFQSYLAGHANDRIIVNAGGGFIFDANAFSNAPDGTNIGDFVANNPVQNPPSGNVWDGTGTPGETQEADLTAYNAALAAVAEADYTAESWAAYQAVVAANVVTVENTQAEVDAATAAIVAAQAKLVVKTVDLTAYNAALAAVAEADYTAESWAAYQAVVAANVVTVENTQAEVDAAVAAITAAQANLVVKPAKLAVESVSAINAKTLKVEFNKAVAEEDQAEATFDVKRGTIATTVEVAWAEDGKSVELARATNLVAGDYTVTVEGLDFAEGKNVATVKVEVVKASSIEIETDHVIKDNNAEVVYLVKDQYGDKIKTEVDKISWSVKNLTDVGNTVTVNNGTPATDTALELNTWLADIGDVVRITAVLKADVNVKVTKEVTVEDVFMENFELGEVVFEEDQTKLELNTGATYDVELSYTALDNYGNAVKLDANDGPDSSLGVIDFISSNEDLVASDSFKTDADSKLFFTVKQNKSGKATLTAINTNTAETSSVEIEVFKAAEETSLEFGDFKDDKGVVAGDTDKTAKLAVTFFDQYGEEIDVAKTYDMSTVFNIAVTGAGNLVVEKDLVDGYIVFKDSTAVAGDYTLTITNKNTGDKATMTVTVGEKRVPVELSVKTAPSTSVETTKTTKAQFNVIDQYGAKMGGTEPEATNYKLLVTKKSAGDTKIKVEESATEYKHNEKLALGDAIKELTLTVTDSDEVSFTLVDSADKAIDKKTYDIKAIAVLDSLVVETDKDEYTAGDDIVVTIKAQKSGPALHTDYNKSGVATVEVGTKTYFEDVEFVKGVATVTVPATEAGATIAVKVTFDGKNKSENVKVNAAAASKFKLAGSNADLNITLTDAYGNTIADFAGEKKINVTFPAAAVADGTGSSTLVDANGNAMVTFTAGAGKVTFTANLADGTYTVTFGDYTGTLVK